MSDLQIWIVVLGQAEKNRDSVKINSKLKSIVEAKTPNSSVKLESIPKAKSVLPDNIQTCQNQFYTSNKFPLIQKWNQTYIT